MAYDKLHELHAATILYSDNFHLLHYLLYGPSFHDDHARFNEWYQMIFGWQDVVAEQLLSMGSRPESVISAPGVLEKTSRQYTIIDQNEDYSADAADMWAFKMFNDLYDCCMEIVDDHETYPTDVRSTVRGIAKTIRVENKYKQARRLLTPDAANKAPEPAGADEHPKDESVADTE